MFPTVNIFHPIFPLFLLILLLMLPSSALALCVDIYTYLYPVKRTLMCRREREQTSFSNFSPRNCFKWVGSFSLSLFATTRIETIRWQRIKTGKIVLLLFSSRQRQQQQVEIGSVSSSCSNNSSISIPHFRYSIKLIAYLQKGKKTTMRWKRIPLILNCDIVSSPSLSTHRHYQLILFAKEK